MKLDFISYGINFPAWVWGLIGFIIVSTATIIVWTLRRYRAVAKAATVAPERGEGPWPSVSVVVYACHDAGVLIDLVDRLMTQEYEGSYEVVVVNDGNDEATRDVLSDLSLKYRRQPFFHSFVPAGTVNLSAKKLALTLGIKAAHNDVIVTTAGNCMPTSERWLASLMSGFGADTDVMIGYSHIDSEADRTRGAKYRAFDTVVNAVQWLSYAIHRKPYRGDGNNLAYRRATFFAHKGYSQSMHLHYGDDDVFVSEIADGSNTRVSIVPDSQVVVDYSDYARAHRLNKLRYDFNYRYLHTWASASSSFVTIIEWLMIAAMAAGVAATWLNVVMAGLVIASTAAIWTVRIVAYRKAARALQARKLGALLPLFFLARPFVNLRYRWLNRRYKVTNYTWQQPKR